MICFKGSYLVIGIIFLLFMVIFIFCNGVIVDLLMFSISATTICIIFRVVVLLLLVVFLIFFMIVVMDRDVEVIEFVVVFVIIVVICCVEVDLLFLMMFSVARISDRNDFECLLMICKYSGWVFLYGDLF